MMRMNVHRGQGLLETIIALGLVVVGVVAAITVVTTSIIGTRISGDRAIATQLAREGVEVVRSLRDTNWLILDTNPDGGEWDQGLHQGTDYSGIPVWDPRTRTWSMDFGPTGFQGPKTRVFIDDEGRYRQCDDVAKCQPFEATNIRRLLTLEEICGPVGSPDFSLGTCNNAVFGTRKIGMRVVSTVRVGEGDTATEVTVEEHLYQWKSIEP